jgi:hypothetical protein
LPKEDEYFGGPNVIQEFTKQPVEEEEQLAIEQEPGEEKPE